MSSRISELLLPGPLNFVKDLKNIFKDPKNFFKELRNSSKTPDVLQELDPKKFLHVVDHVN